MAESGGDKPGAKLNLVVGRRKIQRTLATVRLNADQVKRGAELCLTGKLDKLTEGLEVKDAVIATTCTPSCTDLRLHEVFPDRAVAVAPVSAAGAATPVAPTAFERAEACRQIAKEAMQEAAMAELSTEVAVAKPIGALECLEDANTNSGFKVGDDALKARLLVFDPPWNCLPVADGNADDHDVISEEYLGKVLKAACGPCTTDDARIYLFCKFQDIGRWSGLLAEGGWKVGDTPYLFVVPGTPSTVRCCGLIGVS